MFPLWDTAIEPVLKAAGARRVVEIGALRGETTVKVLDALGPDAELHVIDPLPEFDPTEHEQHFKGRYIFHRDLSLNVLPSAPAFDAALIDGDHNWYTVYNECRQLAARAREEGQDLPVLILHDVLWPYGRRDLYYNPETIPAEHRQPHDRRGMRPGQKRLLKGGGMNIGLANAVEEGGPRNGVMTGLEDFMAEYDRALRRVVVPIYFGLAIVVEEALLARRPELGRVLDHLESPDGTRELLLLSEQIRLDATVFEHNVDRVRNERLDRARRRYLDLLQGALLDEHYLENELRIAHLLECVEKRRPPMVDALRDPASKLPREMRALRRLRDEGLAGGEDGPTAAFPYTTMGRTRLQALDCALGVIHAEGVPGDLVECGTGRGGGAVYLRGYLEAIEEEHRQVWIADRFLATADGSDPHPPNEDSIADLLADVNQVRAAFDRFGLLDERVRFLQGRFDATLPDAPVEQIALLRIGAATGADAGVALEVLYDRVVPGGYVIVEDTSDPACARSVEEFLDDRGISDGVDRLSWSGLVWRKGDEPAHSSAAPAAVRPRPPLAPPAPPDTVDLSVVVVFYDMGREAERTLHSLSRSYQRGIDGLDYEVIAVENGTPAGRRLDEDFVRSFGPEFRYVDLGDEASPSPTVALNRGIAVARGEHFALMIDGAHVLTPGVLRFGMTGLRSYAPAVVATQQWYVGPGQQPDMVEVGYDEEEEDALFRRIGWPADGYRLFDIGHFIGERDWFEGIIESNCIFAPRSLLEQVGGFDDGFDIPGGGYANLELFERLTATPDVTLVTPVGEGSFHQVHGGTTTNDSDRDKRRRKIVSYGEQYKELRGKVFHGPAKPLHLVGRFEPSGARRTRSRRMTAQAFAEARSEMGVDGIPDRPLPLPDELRLAFIEGFWQSLAWQDATWLGHRLAHAPTDLITYQQLVVEQRPDWIIEVGTGEGGRAVFFASVCEMIGHGRVVSVDDRAEARPEHPRITYVEHPGYTPEAFDEVDRITGHSRNALVVLGSRHAASRIVQSFRGYAEHVPEGGYVIVENTIVNGRPVWPGYGPGPTEAIRSILPVHGDFMADTTMERFGLTFNPGGYLKRITRREG